MANFLMVEDSSRRFLALLKVLVPTCRAAEIVGFSVYHRFNPAPFGKVGFTKGVFDHHIIDLGQILLGFRPGRRFTGEYERLQCPIAQVDQKAKD
jgi:hypothetical protein